MRSYEVRKIGVGSVFKFYFVFGMVFGFLAGVVILIMGASLENMGLQLGVFNLTQGGLLQIGASILGIIVLSLGYGLITGVAGAIGAFLYNIFAGMTGGIVVRLVERE